MAAVPPIQAFFATYGFPYDPQLETMDQFRSMSNAQGWQHDSPVRHQALEELRDAIAMQFNLAYGEDVNDLTAWHALFQVLRLTNIPDTVGGCKAVRAPQIPSRRCTNQVGRLSREHSLIYAISLITR